MGTLFFETIPALFFHPVSDCHAPPPPAVVRTVPPTAVTQGSSDGQTTFAAVLDPWSPVATNTVCPCAAISSRIGSRLLSSLLHPQEQLTVLATLSAAIWLKIDMSLPPT